jgi:HD-like signal output (HDOD) protein
VDNLSRLVRQIDGFPTLPNVITDALEELERPECDFEEVASLVSLDPVLAARVLRLANSAFFGAVQKAETVEAAICRLGIKECRAMLLTVGLMTAIPELPPPHNAKIFWTSSLASALVAHQLARDLAHPTADRAYLAGLLHLLGEGLLAIKLTERFRLAIDVAHRDGLPLVLSLTEEFGCDFAALGAEILQRWAFPDDLIDAVKYQLTPQESRRDPLLAAIVAASDGICRDHGLGLLERQHTGRSWMQAMPDAFHRAVTAAGYAGLEPLLEHLEPHVQEAIDFAVTVF